MTRLLDAVLEPALWFLADWSLRWALLIALLATGLFVLRPRRAATRSLVCWVVLVAGLCLPVLPQWGTGVRLERSEPTPIVALLSEPPTPWEHVRLLEVPEVHPPPVAEASPSPGPTTTNQPLTTAAADVSPRPTPADESLGVRRWLVLGLAALWLTGVFLTWIRWLGGCLLLARIRRSAVPASETTLPLFEACCKELGLRRSVRLATHAAVQSPITLGLLRPTIVVPPAWSDLTASGQRAVLLHELAHLARRDDWSALALEWVRTVFFFHPLVHWLLSRIECEREILCDEAALAHGTDPYDYARLLVEFARHSNRLLPVAFAGPSYPLRLGKRRTVKIRIHHLLEEAMHPVRSPLTTRRALALAGIVLALALGVGSFRLRALEPVPKPKAAAQQEVPDALGEARGGPKALPAQNDSGDPARKQALRYGGKRFYEWRDVLTNDLKPAVRVEAIEALTAFGLNGYGPEAAAAIIKVMHGYDPARLLGEAPVITAARDALVNLGPAAGPPLLEELKQGKVNSRRFAILALLRLRLNTEAVVAELHDQIKDSESDVRNWAIKILESAAPMDQKLVPALVAKLKANNSRTRVEALQSLARLGPRAKSAVPVLMAALKDADPQVRDYAVRGLESIEADAKVIVPALIEALADKQPVVRNRVIRLLGTLGPEAKDALPALLTQAADEGREVVQVRPGSFRGFGGFVGRDARGVSTLVQIAESLAARGPEARSVVPGVVKALQNQDATVRSLAADVLSILGPEAREAVPPLMVALKDPDERVRLSAVNALGRIGSAAKEAIPVLSQMLKIDNRELRAAITQTLSTISR